MLIRLVWWCQGIEASRVALRFNVDAYIGIPRQREGVRHRDCATAGETPDTLHNHSRRTAGLGESLLGAFLA